MKIFIAEGVPFNGAPYLEEILRALGLCCVRGLKGATLCTATDLLLVPAGADEKVAEDFLRNGGSVLAIRPQQTIVQLAGLQIVGERITPGRLRLSAPLCAAAGGEALWTLGAQTIYENELSVEESASHTLAYIVESGYPDSESVAIYRRPVGSGTLMIFAYDPAYCIMRLRQGWPERAGMLPPGEIIPRSIYLHEADAPHDTLWRPTADLHALVLSDAVKSMLSSQGPLPTLWHIPYGKPSVLLFTGDEDGADQKDNEAEMDDLESCGGTMSLYVIPDQTSITREDIARYQSRGHEISVHPNLVPMCEKSKEEQLGRARAHVEFMRDTFGVPVATVRNHSVMWPGYLDLPELWERLGIGLDANALCSSHRRSLEAGLYAHGNAALPLRFVREDGTLIDVLQQPTHFSDDLYCHPHYPKSHKYSPAQFSWVVRRMLEEAARRFHVPHCPVIHPGNYATYSRAHGRLYMHYAQEMDMPMWSLDRWQNFWRARLSWQIENFSWEKPHLTLQLSGTSCEGLTVVLPAEYEGYALTTVHLDGKRADVEIVERYWQNVAQVVLPVSVESVWVTAQYAA